MHDQSTYFENFQSTNTNAHAYECYFNLMQLSDWVKPKWLINREKKIVNFDHHSNTPQLFMRYVVYWRERQELQNLFNAEWRSFRQGVILTWSSQPWMKRSIWPRKLITNLDFTLYKYWLLWGAWLKLYSRGDLKTMTICPKRSWGHIVMVLRLPRGDNFNHSPNKKQSIFVLYTKHIDFCYLIG